ncbi:hypothetical protein ACHAWF_018156, partial [Thalassiosira exigua]
SPRRSDDLKDALSTIAINPGFSKSYSWKGKLLQSLKRYNDNDTMSPYKEGHAKFPDDEAL